MPQSLLDLSPLLSANPAPINGLPGPHIIFTGANVHIRNGSGGSGDGVDFPGALNGRGNLIVGHNESVFGIVNKEVVEFARPGSHNLVVGPAHLYDSAGGLITGYFNQTSGLFATVSGGFRNKASGFASSVGGGQSNFSESQGSSVSGGHNNIATGLEASVSGGAFNVATGTYSSVSGGQANEASGNRSSVSGGTNLLQNNATGWSGGTFHTP